MKLDSLFSGAQITSVTPKMEYSDGEATGVQDSSGGVPLWQVEVAVQDGPFVLPLRVKAEHPTEPRPGDTVRFRGLEVRAFQGKLYYAAEGFEVVQGDDLDTILQGGGSDD